MAKKAKTTNDVIFVGKKPIMNYVMAGLVVLEDKTSCTFKARGNSINKLLNATEMLKRKFDGGIEYRNIKIDTEVIETDDRKNRVTAFETELYFKTK